MKFSKNYHDKTNKYDVQGNLSILHRQKFNDAYYILF